MKMSLIKRIPATILLLLLTASCARMELDDPKGALRKVSVTEFKTDTMSGNFLKALSKNLAELERRVPIRNVMNFGPVSTTKENYVRALKSLRPHWGAANFKKKLFEIFDVYEIYGYKENGKALVTGYYTPVIKGSKKAGPILSRPLLKKPEDLVTVRLRDFKNQISKYRFNTEARGVSRELKLLRGRLDQHGNVMPYYSRKQIEKDGILSKRKLEIAYVDPIENFFLQIQGSGGVELPSGEKLYVHYKEQNGHPYESIGKKLYHVIPRELMSMQSLKHYLKNLPPAKRDEVFYMNPSYVFFDVKKSRPRTFFQTEVVDQRVIATDLKFFPKGALCFLDFEDQKLPSGFVFDQDTGGAIKGGGRADFYVGEGDAAGELAGKLQSPAKIYYFVPKVL